MKRLLWGGMTFLAVGVAFYGWYFALVKGAAGDAGMAHHFQVRPTAAYLHFLLGPLALAIGGFQFLPKLRAKAPQVHRWLGRVYVLSCLLSGAGGFALGVATLNGSVAQMGFLTLAVIWIVTTGMAYQTARSGQFKDHRAWMIRSFSLTYAAVTLRIYLPLSLGVFGWEFEVAYPVIAWVAWAPNLVFAEWYLRKNRRLPLPMRAAA